MITKFCLLLFLCSGVAFAQTSEQPPCLACHSSLAEAPVVHGPVKASGCPICHAVDERAVYVPKTGDKKLPSGHAKVKVPDASKITETCLMCHSALEKSYKKSKFKHLAIEAGGCLVCHDPHNSKNKNLLKKPTEDSSLCLTCHDQVMKKFEGYKFQHFALMMGKTCVNCHDPHFSLHDRLIKDDLKTVCLNCHTDFKKELQKNPVKHAPVEFGACNACHAGHGGSEKKFLKQTINTEFYGKFSEEKYQLCFKCHQPALVKNKTVAGETNFRNGNRNLHYAHVVEHKKGMGCFACHDIHSTPGPKLIHNWASYGNLKMPIDYKKTANGGNCTTACHNTKSYDRVKAIANAKGK